MPTADHSWAVIEILKRDTFDRWLGTLRNRRAVACINARLRHASLGNLGDVAPVGEGVSEMRIFYGPGYRLYSSSRDTR